MLHPVTSYEVIQAVFTERLFKTLDICHKKSMTYKKPMRFFFCCVLRYRLCTWVPTDALELLVLDTQWG